MARTTPCTSDIRLGRMRKAAEFFDAASLIADQAGGEAGTALASDSTRRVRTTMHEDQGRLQPYWNQCSRR